MDQYKVREVLLELTHKNIDICGISETKKKEQDQLYTMFFSSVSKKNRAKEDAGMILL